MTNESLDGPYELGERLLTVPLLARLLGLSEWTAWQIVGDGQIASLKVRGSRRVSTTAIGDYLGSVETGGPPKTRNAPAANEGATHDAADQRSADVPAG